MQSCHVCAQPPCLQPPLNPTPIRTPTSTPMHDHTKLCVPCCRATTAPASGSSLSSTTALVSTGDLLGYKTQYRTMTAAVAAKAQLQATLAASGEGMQLAANDSTEPEIIRHAVRMPAHSEVVETVMQQSCIASWPAIRWFAPVQKRQQPL